MKEDGAAIEAALVFLLVLFKACWSFLVFSALPTPEDNALFLLFLYNPIIA